MRDNAANNATAGASLPDKKPTGLQMKKIDAGYYFRNIEPQQVANVVKNFYQELADGRKRFKEILL